ncbi:MAG: hypothetical protein HFE39_10440 [Clostridiales bacterium]|jgi:hypothetical protein|nr:hypothetical protein [Clostridiales bacterium]
MENQKTLVGALGHLATNQISSMRLRKVKENGGGYKLYELIKGMARIENV